MDASPKGASAVTLTIDRAGRAARPFGRRGARGLPTLVEARDLAFNTLVFNELFRAFAPRSPA